MIDRNSLRKLVLALPEAMDESVDDKLRFSVDEKGFAWTYLERIGPRMPRRAHMDVLAVRCTIEHKEMLIETEPDTFFDDDHYHGYPAVLVRLAAVERKSLTSLLESAWRLRAPTRLLKPRQHPERRER